MRLPSEDQEVALIEAECALTAVDVSLAVGSGMFHRRTVLSDDAVAIRDPSGKKTMSETELCGTIGTSESQRQSIEDVTYIVSSHRASYGAARHGVGDTESLVERIECNNATVNAAL